MCVRFDSKLVKTEIKWYTFQMNLAKKICTYIHFTPFAIESIRIDDGNVCVNNKTPTNITKSK